MANEDIRRESRPVSGFDRIAFRGVGQVIVAQGEADALEIEARVDVLPKIGATVEGTTLALDTHRDWIDWLGSLFSGVGPIRYYVTMKNVAGLNSSGAGSLEAARIATDRLDIALSGAGSISIGDLQARELTAFLSGVGSVDVSGHVDNEDIRLTGTGSFRGDRLESVKAHVSLTGVGSARVWVRDDLDVSLSGVGSVDYYGGPRVMQRATGVGKINALGPR